jgi:hypothetical protein
MADEADLGNEKAIAINDESINRIRWRARTLEVEVTGYCLCCGNGIVVGRWCDADCRDEWERSKRR